MSTELTATTSPIKKRPREIRLDFFRGICLFIIFVAHIYDNPWAQWIPARFGFSDATEIFVFCSGMASAIAFGRIFETHGIMLGTSRVIYRIWQVYWAHVTVLLATATLMVLIDRWFATDGINLQTLMLDHLFNEHAQQALVGLLTLTWVPPFFDILPMYLVILMMLPVVIALSQIGRVWAAIFCISLWLASSFYILELPREHWDTGTWYFNPFSWQLIFFTGFALMRGWLPAPPVNKHLIWLASAILALSLPFAWIPLLETFDWLRIGREAISPLVDKSHLGILRYVHFLALAYLACVIAGERGKHIRGNIAAVVCKVGQQSLAVFVSGLVLSFVASALLLAYGRTIVTVQLANIAGCALLVAIAYVSAWFKSAPWSKPPQIREAKTPRSWNTQPSAAE